MADFPTLPFRPYLTDWLLDLGLVAQTMNGLVAVPHTELQAWAINVGLVFEGAEAEWLNKMSAAYAAELTASSGKDAAQPYQDG